MNNQAKIGDAIVLAYMDGDEAMPESVGDGYTIATTEDGGVQLAIHWTDRHRRHTVLVQGGMLRLFEGLAGSMRRAVKNARKRKVTQERGELTRERSDES